ncbi:uncharacterized protein LOC111378147 [Olea europaea var. sylvestris]|uniref:uncharacterized protein LOC111378147 n=1 Tax=Olea europaea var. sylvestris TaxID=158386 RepID=UPI000C1D54A6|nr:uncharacterized protein LOC111378147 [Olea europaea var. sylvestris]
MRHFKSCLKDAESKQGGSHEVANLIIDMKELALDIEDIFDTSLPEIESHKGKGPFRFVKHAACILCYGFTKNTFALKIEKIKRRAQEIEATRERCRINLDTDGGANSFPELQVLEIDGTKIPELIVDQTGMPNLCKFVCYQKDLNVPERLREIMVEP